MCENADKSNYTFLQSADLIGLLLHLGRHLLDLRVGVHRVVSHLLQGRGEGTLLRLDMLQLLLQALPSDNVGENIEVEKDVCQFNQLRFCMTLSSTNPWTKHPAISSR